MGNYCGCFFIENELRMQIIRLREENTQLEVDGQEKNRQISILKETLEQTQRKSKECQERNENLKIELESAKKTQNSNSVETVSQDVGQLLQENLGFEEDFVKGAISSDAFLIDVSENSERCVEDCLKKIQQLQESTKTLEERVNAFVGTNQEKEYLDLKDMLIKNLVALEEIESKDSERLERERKNALLCIENCLELLKTRVL